MRGLSLVAASGDHSSSRCAGLSLSRPLLLRSTGSKRAGSVVVAHGPSCSAACGIFPDQGSNPCPLHWQADSQPLRHQGSPPHAFKMTIIKIRRLRGKNWGIKFLCKVLFPLCLKINRWILGSGDCFVFCSFQSIYLTIFLSWLRLMACGILRPGIEPVPPAVEAQSPLTTGLPGNSLSYYF